jgi:hypothetical protein
MREATDQEMAWLEREGWERRFIADAHRAGEAMELYTKLGYEVRAEPVRPSEMSNDCDDCQLIALLQFTTIYTRRRSQQGPVEASPSGHY